MALPTVLDLRNEPTVLAAMVVGTLVRVAWVIAAARTPSGEFTDSAQFLAMVDGLLAGDLPTLGGAATAFHPVGYPATIAPIAGLFRLVGGSNLAAAMVVNVVAGVATIALAWACARTVVGVRHASVAAWVVALAPSLVIATAAPMSETLFGAQLLTALLLAARLVERRSSGSIVAFGVLAAWCVLTRSTGVVVLIAPVSFAVIGAAGRRSPLRPIVVSFVVAGTILGGWAVRNGVEVGHWSPLSTNNAANLCGGTRPNATGAFDNSLEMNATCYRNSPWDDPNVVAPEVLPEGWSYGERDESAWYRSTVRRSLGWLLADPLRQMRLLPTKFGEVFGQDSWVDDVGDFGAQPVLSHAAATAGRRIAQAISAAVVVFGLIGALRSGSRSLPAVIMLALLVIATMLGMGMSRYAHPLVVVAAVLTSGVWGRRGAAVCCEVSS